MGGAQGASQLCPFTCPLFSISCTPLQRQGQSILHLMRTNLIFLEPWSDTLHPRESQLSTGYQRTFSGSLVQVSEHIGKDFEIDKNYTVPEYSLEGLIWSWSWSANTLATWCEELTHWKTPWCWARLKAGGEGDDRGWHSWMASPTQQTWVWANSGR